MIGTRLRQRYLIKELLGKGGFGETYLAEDFINIPVTSKYECVVKRLIKPPTPDIDTEKRFKEEAAILKKLGDSHDQIPKLIEFFEENREFYLVQELIDGYELRYLINKNSERWSEDEVIKLLQDTLEVLAFVHNQGVIHRDVKPDNLMRRYSDDKLMLIDFGAFKDISNQDGNTQGQTSSTIGIGTPGYRPIEQLDGHPKFASDVYAVGMTAIEALTGLTPKHKQLNRDEKHEFVWREHAQVSDRFAEILTKMVRYDFRQRYQSADEALQALRSIQLPPPAPALKPFAQNNRWGYEDEKGNEVIPPHFVWADKFSEGLARVRIGKEIGYINEDGIIVIQPDYAYGGKFSEGLARVGNNNKYGYINKKGGFVNQQPFDGALDFSEGMAAVMIDKKWGYIDNTGHEAISFKFDEAENFLEGRARVRINWQWHYIDKTGNFIN